MSAPIPHQGGSGEDVNEQWPDYWAALFDERGFVCVDALRRKIWTNERIEWWYAQNPLPFVKREELANNEALRRELAANPGPPLPLVHPRLYEDRSSAIGPQRESKVEWITRVMFRGLKTTLISSRGYQGLFFATCQFIA